MRLSLQKRSALQIVSRTIPIAQRIGVSPYYHEIRNAINRHLFVFMEDLSFVEKEHVLG